MNESDAGRPMQKNEVASATVRCVEFTTDTRMLSLRNTGLNTLWFTFNNPAELLSAEATQTPWGPVDANGDPWPGAPVWFDVACGTSWEDRLISKRMWYCTQSGETSFVAMGLKLCNIP